VYRSANISSRRNSAKAATLAASRNARSVCFSFMALIACLLVAGLLAGCAQPQATTAKTGKAKPALTTAAKSPDAAAAADGTQAKGQQTAPEPATGWQGPTTLVGLGSEDIRAALGAPARIRDEDLARIYQYVGGDCVLDLFLYQEAGTYRVTYAEARSVKAESQPVDACLKSMPNPVVAANTQPST
jgi:hypothetical protein